jgi:hypothetical protein
MAMVPGGQWLLALEDNTLHYLNLLQQGATLRPLVSGETNRKVVGTHVSRKDTECSEFTLAIRWEPLGLLIFAI